MQTHFPVEQKLKSKLAIGLALFAMIFASSCAGQSGSNSGSDSGADPNAGGSSCDPIQEGDTVTRIAAAGDTGTGDSHQYDVASLIAARDAIHDFLAFIILGDMIYEEGDLSRIEQRVFAPYADTLDDATRLVPVIGNHDIKLGLEDEIMAALGAPGIWYSRRIGPVLLIVLDSTRPNNPNQLAWLEAELVAANAPWIVANMHHPMYSAGFHGSSLDVRLAWQSLFEEHGVDLVLAGHDHDYQRQEIVNDITYIVSGAGAKLRDAGQAAFTVVSERARHFVELQFTNDRLDATAHGLTGTVDTFSICHANSNQPQ